jgi:hypothetical protein
VLLLGDTLRLGVLLLGEALRLGVLRLGVYVLEGVLLLLGDALRLGVLLLGEALRIGVLLLGVYDLEGVLLLLGDALRLGVLLLGEALRLGVLRLGVTALLGVVLRGVRVVVVDRLSSTPPSLRTGVLTLVPFTVPVFPLVVPVAVVLVAGLLPFGTATLFVPTPLGFISPVLPPLVMGVVVR